MDENMEMMESTAPEVESTTTYEETSEGPSVAVVGLVGAAIGATALFCGQKIVKGVKAFMAKRKEAKEAKEEGSDEKTDESKTKEKK